ncbi:Cobyrinic acid A,C-diamide synthase [Caloramator mitchellensis]|uniref:Cobyrinic acid A,C-diamide synthase n=1 Tax=Caloramator mitchellensis TaxID=908809 RepID=A0A0R3JR42_CALMK|nr:cobyrinate a,c-diamide synthase [Caloramator mitchellensis]KRQ85921.1 Cobyrinic acid A,C-diamide synthase [Caloramator mitchellensis]
MKGIVISAPNSGSGKTILTSGLIKALMDLNYTVFPCKTGPDYIDTAFLGRAAKYMAQNLDMHLQGDIKHAIDVEKDLCIVEGAMGYFDGIYNTFENSSFNIAKNLNLDTVLIYTPKGEMFSAIPKIKGMVDFAGNIKGIIFNRISKHYYELLKSALEQHVDIKVLGFIEEKDDYILQSRHLGLIQSSEIEDIDKKVNTMAENIKKNIDIETMLSLFKDVEAFKKAKYDKTGFRAAIAMDKAFSFYYRENLEILNSLFDVTYFSPIEDDKLPECDFLYLGGGYPEVFKKELSRNKTMLNSIRQYSQNGGYIFAECGGLMYLTKEIDGFEMTGVFDGISYMTDRLQNFGYVDVEIKNDCLIGKKGDKFTGHEFHKSLSQINCVNLLTVKKTMGNRITECGYQVNNTFAMYQHVSFLGSFNIIENIISNMKGE